MKWAEHYKNKELIVSVEVTTKCNAACPQCKRTINSDSLPLFDVDFETFKKWFPLDTVSNISTFLFSGNHCDAPSNKYIVEIIEYIIENSEASIIIETNGSLRSEDWWFELGMLCGSRLSVTFDVDGTDQEMHSRYRINTNLKKILSNMESLSYTRANINVFTVIFKHNHDYLQQIQDMCKEYGAKTFEYVQSNRFRDNNEKQYSLEQVIATDTITNNNSRAKFFQDRDITSIDCYWEKDKKLFIGASGHVYPCCHIASIAEGKNLYDYGESRTLHEDFKSVLTQDTCLHNNALVEILNSSLYVNGMDKNHLNTNNAEKQCRNFCGKT